MMARSSWETPTNFLDEAIAQYRLDPWAEADARPVLFAESAGPLLALDATLNTYSVAGVPTRARPTDSFARPSPGRSPVRTSTSCISATSTRPGSTSKTTR
jgi:hypothetical protein